MNSFRVLPLFLIALLTLSSLSVNKVLATQRIPVTICHATGSQSNPYVKQTVDDNAVDGNGNEHNDHNMANHQSGEDIIPAGSWDGDGRNWNANGQAIWNNNCNLPQSTPAPSASPSPSVSVHPSASPSVSPSASPSASASASAAPSASPSASPSPLGSASPSASPIASASPVASASPSASPSANVSASPSPSASSSASPAPQGSCCTPTTDIPGPGTGIGSAESFRGGSQGEVLGISTLAPTGSFEDSIRNVMMSLGAVLVVLSQSLNARKKV